MGHTKARMEYPGVCYSGVFTMCCIIFVLSYFSLLVFPVAHFYRLFYIFALLLLLPLNVGLLYGIRESP